MKESRNCPTLEQLSNYARGILPLEQADIVGDHLETCAECETKVELLEVQAGSLVRSLRRRVLLIEEHDSPEFRRAMKAAENAGRARDPLAPVTPVLPIDPQELGEYRVLERLGKGGM